MNINIVNLPNFGNAGCDIDLATDNPATHMNLYIRAHNDSETGWAQMTPETAKALRDALIAAYPVPVPVPVREGSYKVDYTHEGDDDSVYRFTEEAAIEAARDLGQRGINSKVWKLVANVASVAEMTVTYCVSVVRP